MRRCVAVVGAVVAVAVLLLGGWLFGHTGADVAGVGSPGAVTAAPTTRLERESDPSGVSSRSRAPQRYPEVPLAQVDGDESHPFLLLRTGNGGRQLMVPLMDSDCSSDEARLLGEHDDRVEVAIRDVAKPPPPSVTIRPDGSYRCFALEPLDTTHAVIDLRAPLGDRRVVIHQESL